MMNESDLRETERRNYLSYFGDGILDVVAGLPVLLFGLGMLFDASVFFILTWLPIVMFWPLKQMLTVPRLGNVKFSADRQRRLSANYILLLIAGTFSLLLGIAAFLGFEGQAFDIRGFMLEYGLLVFGSVMAGAFLLIAVLFEVRRFLIYAAFVFGGWAVAFALGIEPGFPVAIAGALVTISGLIVLGQFLAVTPLPED